MEKVLERLHDPVAVRVEGAACLGEGEWMRDAVQGVRGGQLQVAEPRWDVLEGGLILLDGWGKASWAYSRGASPDQELLVQGVVDSLKPALLELRPARRSQRGNV